MSASGATEPRAISVRFRHLAGAAGVVAIGLGLSAILDTEFELALMTTASCSVIALIALWNARVQGVAERARQQSRRDEQFLFGLGDLPHAASEPSEVLFQVATQLGEYLHASRCLFSEVDLETDRVTIHPDYHCGLSSLAGRVPLSSFGGNTAAEYARGDPVAIADTTTDVRTAAAFERAYRPFAIRSVITVPVMREGRWVGSLSISSCEPRTWEEREVTLVKQVAQRAWLWVEHLEALAKLRAREVAVAVQQTEERFQALVEGIRDYAIFLLDPDGKVATWNAGAARLTGTAASEAIGRHVSMFFTPEDRAGDHARFVLEHALHDGRYEEEGWRVHNDGSLFWANMVITSLRDHAGVPEGFAAVTRDFTERRAQDEALRARQAALAHSVREREVLLQEVHHRVKNNLQVISSLINMQVRNLEQGGTRDALQECQTRVLAIALIHEKLYQSNDYARVRFSDYARSLAANVFHTTGTSQNDVSLELAIDEVPLGVDRAIPCGLVINELITNSLKHAFTDGRTGTIRVELKKLDDGQLCLKVQDDGVGLPHGFEIHKIASMGLQLVCTLSEQLDASLVVNGDRGASFQLTFAGGN